MCHLLGQTSNGRRNDRAPGGVGGGGNTRLARLDVRQHSDIAACHDSRDLRISQPMVMNLNIQQAIKQVELGFQIPGPRDDEFDRNRPWPQLSKGA